jgi:hypothetical protein
VRRLRTIVLGVLLFAGMSGACFAGALPVGIKAAVDKKAVTIGENVTYTISVAADKSIDIEFPDLTKAFKGLSVVDSGEKTGFFFNRRTRTVWVVLRTFTPGAYQVPKQEIKYKKHRDSGWNTAFTDECSVNVVSLLGKAGAAAGLADIKGPLDIRTPLPVILLLSLVVLILVMVFWKKIFPGKKKAEVLIQPWKAHETAYARLDELRRKGLLAKGMIKQYYTELSDILRHYLENRFSLKAPEMTTEEFIVYMREYSEIGREQKDLLKEFLTNCDLVKFARYVPPESEGDAVFDTVKMFVDRTKAAEPDQASQPQQR